jgi:hypothetical protein
MIELRLRSLGRFALSLLLVFGLTALALFALRHRQFSQQPRPLQVVSVAASPDLIAPVLGSVTLHSDAPAWQAAWRKPQATITAAFAARYPGLHKRFPDGVRLTLVEQPQAPEPLRGPYDDQPAELTVGAVYPEPQPGESVQPLAEAWAGCRRDLELGPARQLRCYLFVRGEPGDTLDGLAVLAWIQALDEALSGRLQPLDRNNLPLLDAHKEGEQWTYSDAYLSLSSSP